MILSYIQRGITPIITTSESTFEALADEWARLYLPGERNLETGITITSASPDCAKQLHDEIMQRKALPLNGVWYQVVIWPRKEDVSDAPSTIPSHQGAAI